MLKVDRRAVRDFYEIEAIRNGWSVRQLEWQIASLLFQRLSKSRDKKGVLALASVGQVLTRPQDAIKGPYVLEFLDLPESHRLVESRVEEALIGQMQAFLLELGRGFAFVGRQLRLRRRTGVIDDLFKAFHAGQYRVEPRDVAKDHRGHSLVVPCECATHRMVRGQREGAGRCRFQPQVRAAEEEPRMAGTVEGQRVVGLPLVRRRRLHQLMHIVVVTRDALPAMPQFTAAAM